MSLLDDVSIVVTPNGYKAGTLFGVIPVPTLGADVITNGDFATDSDWSKGGNWSIGGGVATANGNSNGNIAQSVPLTVGTAYSVTYTVVNASAGSRIGISTNATSIQIERTTDGTYTETFTASLTSFYIRALWNNGNPVSLDNISVKEWTGADMDVTRATAATRVDEDGLVNYAEILGGEEVTNGDFTQLPLGTSWDAYTSGSSTVAFTEGAILSIDGSNSNVGVYQQNIFTNGVQYKIVVSVKATASFDAEIVESQGAATQTTIGTVSLTTSYQDFVFYFTGTGTNDLFIHRLYGETAGQNQQIYIKDVSVKELTRDNVPRIDYTGGGCPHILAEPQRTNQFVQSNNFNTSWTQTSVDVATDVITSPISGELADSVTATTATAQHRVLQTPASTGIGTFTMYIKQGELSRICIHFLGTNKAVGFDCSDNTTFAATGIASYPTRYAISDFGNGWSKLEMYDVGSTTRVDIYIANPTVGGNNAVWTGDGTSKIYFAAAQFELGSYATSYIPTSGSTVTRNQDIFTRDGIGSLINSTEGVLFVEIASLSESGNYRELGLSDGTTSNRVLISYKSTDNVIRGSFQGSGGANLEYTVTSSKDFHKIAVKWKVNDFSLWVDGVEVGSDTSGSSFPANTLNSINFNSGSGGDIFFGKVKQLQVYDTALTDTQLAALTS